MIYISKMLSSLKEELEKRENLKVSFLTNVSDELKTAELIIFDNSESEILLTGPVIKRIEKEMFDCKDWADIIEKYVENQRTFNGQKQSVKEEVNKMNFRHYISNFPSEANFLHCLWHGGEQSAIALEDGIDLDIEVIGSVEGYLKTPTDEIDFKDKTGLAGAFRDKLEYYLPFGDPMLEKVFQEVGKVKLELSYNNWINVYFSKNGDTLQNKLNSDDETIEDFFRDLNDGLAFECLDTEYILEAIPELASYYQETLKEYIQEIKKDHFVD